MADPAPLWQKPLVSLSQFFLKTPVQVHAHQQTSSYGVLAHSWGEHACSAAWIYIKLYAQ